MDICLKRNDKNCQLIDLMTLGIKKNPNYFNRKKISALKQIKEFSYKSISLKYNKIYETI